VVQIKRVKPSDVKPATAASTAIKPTRGAQQPLVVTIPREATPPSENLGDYSLFLHGEKKIGKTSLAARFPDAFFMLFEPGGKGLNIRREPVPSWRHYIAYIDALEKDSSVSTVVVDTCDVSYNLCFDYVAKRDHFKHPGDLGWGEGWKAIREEFEDQYNRLLSLGKGVIIISHTDVAEFQSRRGNTYNKLVPTVAKSARKYLSGICDIIAYYGYYGDDRLLTIEGSDDVEAGHRIETHFRTPSGERIHSIPMGVDADEAYANFLLAFDNKQKDRHVPEDFTMLTETPAPPKKKTR
jgi:hypothetical protein